MAESLSFQAVELNLAGPSSESRSTPISVQRTVNLYPDVHESGINETSLQAWPGLLDFYESGLSTSKVSRNAIIDATESGSFTLLASGDILGMTVDELTGNVITLDPRDQINIYDGLSGTLSSSFTYPGGNARSVSVDSDGNLVSIDVSVSPRIVNKHSGIAATVSASFTGPGTTSAACIDSLGNAYVFDDATDILYKMTGFTSTVDKNTTLSGTPSVNGLIVDADDILYLMRANGGMTAYDTQTLKELDSSDPGGNSVVGIGKYNNNLYWHEGSAADSVHFVGLTTSAVTSTQQYKYGRGAHVFKGDYYAVIQSTLYKISKTGTATSIGSIPANGMCTFADNGTTMVICFGGVPMYYDGTTLGSLDVTFTAKTVDYINNQFVFSNGDGKFSVADAGEITVNALNFATPEASPDDLTSVKVFNQILYLISERSVEPWANTGTGNPPFERMSEAIIEDVGCLSPYGVTSTDKAMYFIGQDAIPYQIQSFQAIQIGNSAIAKTFRGYTLKDVVAWTVTLDGQKFAVFGFPTDERTWAYSEKTGQWIELDHGNKGERYLGNTCHEVYSKKLVQNYNSASIYELDFDTFQNSGDTIVRKRRLAVIAGETFGKPGYSLEMSKIKFSIETGVGIDSGQGSEPKLMITPSYDGGKTWSKQIWLNIGEGGEFSTDVEWHNMKVFDRLVVDISFSDPTRFSLYAATAFLREAGF